MKINFIGDSITYGEHLNRNDTWTSLIQKTRKGDTIINRGISGDTTAGMLSRFQTEVILDNPDAVHIMGGLNDIICGGSADQIKGNFKAMSQQAKFYQIKPIIGICPLPVVEQINPAWKKFTDFDRLIQQMQNLNEWLCEYSAISSGVFVVDYATELSHRNNQIGSDLYLDGMHLNQKGNKLLSETFIDFLETTVT